MSVLLIVPISQGPVEDNKSKMRNRFKEQSESSESEFSEENDDFSEEEAPMKPPVPGWDVFEVFIFSKNAIFML